MSSKLQPNPAFPLVARLVKAEKVQISMRPGRVGWSLTSPLSLQQVRICLQNWAPRVVPLHQPSGRYFVQPSQRYFQRVLRPVPYHKEFHGCPVRSERMRRLRPFLERDAKGPRCRGGGSFGPLALRLEALATGRGSQALWRHVGHDFDELWARVPLYAVKLEPWQRLVLNLLCYPVSSTPELGKGTYKE